MKDIKLRMTASPRPKVGESKITNQSKMQHVIREEEWPRGWKKTLVIVGTSFNRDEFFVAIIASLMSSKNQLRLCIHDFTFIRISISPGPWGQEFITRSLINLNDLLPSSSLETARKSNGIYQKSSKFWFSIIPIARYAIKKKVGPDLHTLLRCEMVGSSSRDYPIIINCTQSTDKCLEPLLYTWTVRLD